MMTYNLEQIVIQISIIIITPGNTMKVYESDDHCMLNQFNFHLSDIKAGFHINKH